MHSPDGIVLLFVIPPLFVAAWVFTGYGVALMSGWRQLAQRFRMQGDFSGTKWSMQSAKMRYGTGYNNALTIGADSTGMFLAPLALFRMGHSPLFIPWAEISDVRAVTVLYFFKFTAMRLGRTEQIPFRIQMGLAARLKAIAGPAWPEGNSNWELPPPPIG